MSLPEYKFLDSKEDYECTICTLVLTTPVQIKCCGAVFCKSCIEQWSSSNREGGTALERRAPTSCCPHCRTSPLLYYDDKRTERMIKSLTVTCSNHKSGCKWTGELRNLSSHLSSTNTAGCEYQVIPCPSKCGENVLRSHLSLHSKEKCVHRKAKCTFCQMTGSYKIITGSHYDECPKVKISCPNGCTISSVLRSELQEHIKQCPLEIVPCDYANAGCSQRMTRKDIEIHQVTGMNQHLNLVNKKLSQLLEHIKCRDHIAPIVMKMSYIRQQQEKWNSPCFYTHTNGYKLQLKVSVSCIPPTNQLFKDTNADFLSVSIVPVEGLFDEHLSWPMCARISVQLLNQDQNSHHHSVTFQIEWKRHKTAPHCIEQFLACAELNNPRLQAKFLVNDSLFFQVLVELLGDCKPKPWLNPTLVLT